jgi:hypothetical protein
MDLSEDYAMGEGSASEDFSGDCARVILRIEKPLAFQPELFRVAGSGGL